MTCTECGRDVPSVPVVPGVFPSTSVTCAHVRADGSKCDEGAVKYRERNEQREMFNEMLRSPEFAPGWGSWRNKA